MLLFFLKLTDIPCLNTLHSILTRKKGGGCTNVVDSSLESNLISNLCVVGEVFESVAVEIKTKKSSHTVLEVYHPPVSSFSLFNSKFFSMLDTITGKYIIIGDFYVNIYPNVFFLFVTDFIIKFSCRGYVALINISTRRTDHSGTSLDRIYTNSKTWCVLDVIQALIPYHVAVFL